MNACLYTYYCYHYVMQSIILLFYIFRWHQNHRVHKHFVSHFSTFNTFGVSSIDFIALLTDFHSFNGEKRHKIQLAHTYTHNEHPRNRLCQMNKCSLLTSNQSRLTERLSNSTSKFIYRHSSLVSVHSSNKRNICTWRNECVNNSIRCKGYEIHICHPCAFLISFNGKVLRFQLYSNNNCFNGIEHLCLASLLPTFWIQHDYDVRTFVHKMEKQKKNQIEYGANIHSSISITIWIVGQEHWCIHLAHLWALISQINILMTVPETFEFWMVQQQFIVNIVYFILLFLVFLRCHCNCTIEEKGKYHKIQTVTWITNNNLFCSSFAFSSSSPSSVLTFHFNAVFLATGVDAVMNTAGFIFWDICIKKRKRSYFFFRFGSIFV